MSDYKLVPVEPTPEMVSAAEDAYMPFGDMELAIRMALLAAPAVQGEPVERLPAMMKIEHNSPGIAIEKDILGTVHIKIGDFDYIQIQYQYPHTDNARQLRHAMLIADVLTGATPQPAEQQPAPDVAGLAASLYQACGAYDMPERILDVLSAAANGEPFEHMIDGLLPCVPPSDQDVAALVDALTELCDEIDIHDIHSAISKTNILWFKRKARAALAAHRKQQEPSHDNQ